MPGKISGSSDENWLVIIAPKEYRRGSIILYHCQYAGMLLNGIKYPLKKDQVAMYGITIDPAIVELGVAAAAAMVQPIDTPVVAT